MIYLDNAATTQISKKALEAMVKTMVTNIGNPSSPHDAGKKQKQLIEGAREKIASCIGAKPHEIYFTSGGTESDNWALECAAQYGEKTGKKHIIASAFEHHAVLNKLKELERRGFDVTLIDPSMHGVIHFNDIDTAIREDTCLVTVMAVNNEIGTTQDYKKISSLCAKRKVLFHTDAVQGLPHLIFELNKTKVNYLSGSAHKFGGPHGVGFLYVREKSPLISMIQGGAQERGSRAGTENVEGIVGMAEALCEQQDLLRDGERQKAIVEERKYIVESLRRLLRPTIGVVLYNGDYLNGEPTIINLYIQGVSGESLVSLMNRDGIYISAGSACTSGDPAPSHVLKAIGLPDNQAYSSIRISLSERELLSQDMLKEVVDSLVKNINFLRGV